MLPALQIIGDGRIQQEHADQDKEDGLQPQKAELHPAEACKQESHQAVEDRIAQVGCSHALGLEQAARRQLQLCADLSLVAVFAGQHILHEGGAFGA